MTSPREALERAKAHLRDESVWSRGYIARTAFGAPCMPNARCARAWSVRGALHAANNNVDAVFYAERALLAALPATHRTLGGFNDDPATTFADVHALFDRAIARTKEVTTREVLERARELLLPESHWTRSAAARTQDGIVCGAMSPYARCWCIMGAITAAARGDVDAAAEAEIVVGRVLPKVFRRIPDFNDDPATTHADVLALLDRAIALAREEESACSA